jgi:hypothetical protein
MTGGHRQLVPISSRHETNASVVWFGSPNIRRGETAPTETTTAFRGLFEQTRGVAARSTTSDHLVVLEDSQPIPTKLGGIQFRSLQ